MRRVLVASLLMLGAGVAEAGRSQYGWLYGSEVLPTRGTEIQTWVYEKNGLLDDSVRQTLFWWGAFIGVTDRLELVFPTEFLWDRVDGNPQARFTIEKFGIEARYRFTETNLEKPEGVAPLVRIAAKRDVTIRDTAILELDLVTSYQRGRFHGLVDLGVVVRAAGTSGDQIQTEIRPGAGVAIEVRDGLRLGVEGYGELGIDAELKQSRWFGVGPNIAWTHGRFWLSASYLVGVHQIDSAPRAVWGILF